MICRSKERAEKARDEIVNLTANHNVKVVLVCAIDCWNCVMSYCLHIRICHVLLLYRMILHCIFSLAYHYHFRS